MIEVYNEHIQDLLTEEQKGALDVKMKGKRLYLAGLTEVVVQEEEDITKIMDMGDANRSVAATNMNSTRYITYPSYCHVLITPLLRESRSISAPMIMLRNLHNVDSIIQEHSLYSKHKKLR